MTDQVKHLPAGEGRTFRVIGGDVITCKAAAEDTDGSYSVFETETPPGCGPPPHVHHREDESFYVLRGEFEFVVGDEKTRAAAGSFLTAPRDIPHVFQNAGNEPGRLLVIVRPSGIEKFFEEFSRIPPDAPPDLEKMSAVAAKYGLEFLV